MFFSRHAIENAAASYRVEASGAIRCGMCVCSFQLTDQLAGDGGFACIPGAHSASPLAPSPPTNLSGSFLPCAERNFRAPDGLIKATDHLHALQQVEAPAGSLIIFTVRALCFTSL